MSAVTLDEIADELENTEAFGYADQIRFWDGQHDAATEQLRRIRESFGLKPDQEITTDTIEGMRQADYVKGVRDGESRADLGAEHGN